VNFKSKSLSLALVCFILGLSLLLTFHLHAGCQSGQFSWNQSSGLHAQAGCSLCSLTLQLSGLEFNHSPAFFHLELKSAAVAASAHFRPLTPASLFPVRAPPVSA